MPNIIVIGASAGGVEPLRYLVRALPADFPAATFVVMHVSPLSPPILPKILYAPGHPKVVTAVDGQRIEPARVYVAQPDRHLLVEPGYVRLTRGPRENRHRPAIDPLFRSAARAYGPRVIAVVLTGMLDDGAQGLYIVKLQGGVAIVQDPEEATFDPMPLSAMKAANVDYVLKVTDMPKKLMELVHEQWQPIELSRAKEVLRDFTSPEGEKMSEEYDERLNGKPSIFTCPDCSGPLWEVQDGELLRFRCRVGHAFSPETIRDGYNDSIEGALWSAVRILEQSASLERTLAESAGARGDELAAHRYLDIASGREDQAGMIRGMLKSKGNKEESINDIA